MLEPGSLSSRLTNALPAGVKVRAYHISTFPSISSALFAAPPGQLEQRTECESHFLAISSPSEGERQEIIVFAIEVLIFSTRKLTTVFVSKADSSGFSSRLGRQKSTPSVVVSVTATFLDFLLQPRLAAGRLVLSLFARSQHQYLFPGSIENAGKHVLDDRQLIKWWCRVLDLIVRRYNQGLSGSSAGKATAHLVIPGCDRSETRAFFPPSSRQDSPVEPVWQNSYPVACLAEDTAVPPRCLIPRLPDDPKARFLDDLDDDFISDQGQWRSVKSLEQFWEMMSFRQECSAGRLVGFVWVVFAQDHRVSESDLTLLTPTNPPPAAGASAESSSPLPDLYSATPPISSAGPPSLIQPLKEPPHHLPRDGPLENGNPAPPSAADNLVSDGHCTSPVFIESTQGQVVVDGEKYQTLLDHLLQSDFAGDHLAAHSTRSWIRKALDLSNATAFGEDVEGRSVLAPPKTVEISTSKVNVLTGVRKKRKLDVVEAQAEQPPASEITSTPGSELSKKKTKN